jgi:hypothetical protein
MASFCQSGVNIDADSGGEVALKKTRFIAAALTLSWMLVWSATGGRITGTITNSAGAVVSGAHIVVTNTAQGVQTKATSDAKGTYTFPILPVGRYDLKAEAVGFKPQTRQAVTVHVDDKIQIDLILEVAEKAER